jgi:ribose/xylose/arabinose/galactoside ABC-type transport system permease subunit
MTNPHARLRLRFIIGQFFQSFGLLLIAIIMVAIFTGMNDNYLTLSNLQNILEQNAALAIVAVGVTFSIISTAIDLSPGSIVALAGVVLALVFRDTNSIPLAIFSAILTALAVGLFNGFLVAWVDVNPVIVTLSALIWGRGLALALTGSGSVVVSSPFISFINHRIAGAVSVPMISILLAYLFGWFVLNKTKLGRYTFAIGGDEQAARQAGVNVVAVKMGIFALSGVMVGLASIITVSRLGAAQPNAVFGLELDAIAAVIIGGNRLSGGEGSMRKTIMGVVFIALLNNGLSTLGLRDAYLLFYKGIIILFALFFEVTSRQLLKDSVRHSPPEAETP